MWAGILSSMGLGTSVEVGADQGNGKIQDVGVGDDQGTGIDENTSVGVGADQGNGPIQDVNTSVEVGDQEIGSQNQTEDAKRAYFSVAFTQMLEGGDEPQKVPFDRVLSESTISTYDTENNEFTCTISGAYFFTFAIHPLEDKAASVSLMKNGQGQVMVYAQKKKKGASVCSQSAILDLTEGDKVWLELASGSEYGIRSHPNAPLVTFTGILLK